MSTEDPRETFDASRRIRGPCCRYPTLTERAMYEIREPCDWEDDGQGDDEAGQVVGGPNGPYSLTEARRNFEQHLTIYAPDRGTRIAPDSERERPAKRAHVVAFERLTRAPGAEHPQLVGEIQRQEAVLKAELERKVREWEARGRATGEGALTMDGSVIARQ